MFGAGDREVAHRDIFCQTQFSWQGARAPFHFLARGECVKPGCQLSTAGTRETGTELEYWIFGAVRKSVKTAPTGTTLCIFRVFVFVV